MNWVFEQEVPGLFHFQGLVGGLGYVVVAVYIQSEAYDIFLFLCHFKDFAVESGVNSAVARI